MDGIRFARLKYESHLNSRIIALENQDAAETEARLDGNLFSHTLGYHHLDSPRCCDTNLGQSQRRPDLALRMDQCGDGSR